MVTDFVATESLAPNILLAAKDFEVELAKLVSDIP